MSLSLSAASSLQDWLTHIETAHPEKIDLGLTRIRTVGERLGVSTLPCFKITVAGTNGKGSTCAMLEAIFLAAGYKVGLYTSPHLIDFNERIRVNGDIASDTQIVKQFARIETARSEVSLSYFEFATLAALLTFAEQGVDVVILEVGLGGRLDAANMIDADCSIVTSIDLDHTDWLGDTREQIAFEKAHIFRPGCPAICADPVPPQTLLDYAHEVGADLWLFGRDFNYSGDRQQWSYGGRTKRRSSLAYPALRGANQLLNASAALAAIEALHPRLAVPQQGVRVGLAQVSLPGRMQILPGSPLVVLDVAHNPHAAAVLAQNLDNMPFYPYTHTVVGMLKDKNLRETLEKVAPKVDHWYCANIDEPRGAPGQSLADQLAELTADRAADEPVTISVYDSPEQAFHAAQKYAAENDRILVFGSFHTVGPVLKDLGRKAS